MISEKTRTVVSRIAIWGSVSLVAVIVLFIILRTSNPCLFGEVRQIGDLEICEQIISQEASCPEGTQQSNSNPKTCVSSPKKNVSLYLLLAIIAGIALIWLVGKRIIKQRGAKPELLQKKIDRVTPVQAAEAIKTHFLQYRGKAITNVHLVRTYFMSSKGGADEQVCDMEIFLKEGKMLALTLSLDRGIKTIVGGDFQEHEGHALLFDLSKHRHFTANFKRDPGEILESSLAKLDPDTFLKIHQQQVTKQLQSEEKEYEEEKRKK